MKCYVIGDIHGCLEEVSCLIEALPLEPGDRMVFLGDYVDRGPDPRGVVSYLIELQNRGEQELVFLKGNHEDMLMSYLGLRGEHGDMFLFNGGDATLASYGLTSGNGGPRELLRRMPASHLEFFKRLRIYFLDEPFLCVHAGIHPSKSLADQNETEMLWIRDEFIRYRHLLPHTVLFGHTPVREVFFHLPYKIGLDTGLVYGNALSCLEIREKVLYQIKRGSRRVARKQARQHWDQMTSTA